MDHKNFGQLNVKPLVDDLVQKFDDAAVRLQKEGREAGEAVGRGWDDGLDSTVEKIKASSIKTEKAFKNLSEKIRKQVQQLSANIGGKDAKIKIDFSDIDINSDAIKNKVNKIVKDFSTEGLIEFDTKGSEQQLKNAVTLFVKYQEKIKSLKQVAPNLSNQDDILNNLKQQLVLEKQLMDMRNAFKNASGPLYTDINLGAVNDLSKAVALMQKVKSQTKGGNSQSLGEYDELAKVLKEIQGSLKIISDTFANENNSMKAMAEKNVTSFTSWSQAIIEVYNNLAKVQDIVDAISKKDFNITNITQTGGADSNLQAMTQQMAKARETLEHLRTLYDQSKDTVKMLGSTGQIKLVMDVAKKIQELDIINIGKSVRGANTEMKLASVLAEMQDYIDKLVQINELRNKFGLGEWKDTFVPTQKPVTQPKQQVTETPAVTQPQNTTGVGDAEAQQMTSLKGAVDEVSKAIGRKNAGFIKEKEIVDASVSAEEAKLRELVGVITNEIGSALDNIKAKFEQSFVVPELDKNNLQASFDEIYNKFVELKDKIGTMKINVGINSANITTAIQEALYAKEIAANYKKVEFEDIFDSDFYDGTWTNKFTGEIFDTFDAVDEAFENAFKDLFVSRKADNLDEFFMGTKDEMLADFLSKQSVNTSSEQNDWAQVIVEAINTQGDKIVEAIKIILPKSISGGIDSGDTSVDEAKISEAFEILTSAVFKWNGQTKRTPGEFFKDISRGGKQVKSVMSPDVDNALRTLGLISNSGEITFTMPDTGMRNLGVAIAESLVLNSQFSGNVRDISKLQEKSNEAYKLGASVPRILATKKVPIDDGWGPNGGLFQLQTRSPGSNIASRGDSKDFINATNEQIDRLIHTFEVMSKVGLFPDFIGENILFDKNKGFSLVDLDTRNIHGKPMDTPKDMVEGFLKSIADTTSLNSTQRDDFSKRVRDRLALPAEQRLVNADTIAAERMQQSSNTPGTNAKITPTMDDGAVAKVVADNVAKTPATVKITPVIDSASKSEQAIGGEAQSAVDAAKTFVDAANAKKQFVEANKQVAESAKTSEGAVKKEADAAQTVAAKVSGAVKDLAKVKDVYDNDGNLIRTDETMKFRTDEALVSETTSTRINKNGETSTTTTIIKDFETLTKETKKTEEAVARAQKKLDEFLARFQSKSGGNAKFISGFSDLEGTKVTSDNMEDVFNKMIKLQEEYSKLETNFRKGQSSLNPFVNAITKSENIGTIFGDVERQFNGLTTKSDELVNNFTKLQRLAGDIQKFTKLMNDDPNAISPDMFSEFSKQVGEFNVLKSQVEGSIKAQSIMDADAEKKRAKEVENYINLIKQKNEYEAKAAKGGNMRSVYEAKAAEIQERIAANDKTSIMNQEEQNRLLAIEEAHLLKIAEIKQKDADKQFFTPQNDKLKAKHEAGYLSDADFGNWQAKLAQYQSYLDGTVKADDATIQREKESLTQLYDHLNKISNASKTFFASGGEMLSTFLGSEKIQDAKNSLMELYKQLASDRFAGMETKVTGFSGANEQVKRLTFTVNDGKGALHQYTLALSTATGAVKLLNNSSKETLTTTQSFIKALKGDTRGLFSAFIGGMSGMYAIGRYIKEGIQAVRELDKALTELKKVTDETEETYDRFLQTAGNTSARIGSTLSNFTNATAEFAKLGYDVQQAATMAESALVYTNVGDNIDVETGSQSIISTMKAFGVEANNTMSIVDKFNEVGE